MHRLDLGGGLVCGGIPLQLSHAGPSSNLHLEDRVQTRFERDVTGNAVEDTQDICQGLLRGHHVDIAHREKLRLEHHIFRSRHRLLGDNML